MFIYEWIEWLRDLIFWDTQIYSSYMEEIWDHYEKKFYKLTIRKHNPNRRVKVYKKI